MKTSFLLTGFALIFLWGSAFTQTRQTIHSSDPQVNIEEMAEPSLLFLQEDFEDARIIFSDGEIREQKLRYHILLDEMQFLSRRGQVQNLSKRPSFERIELGGEEFIYEEEAGYLQVLREGEVSLFRKRETRIDARPVKRGAYGGVDHISSIDVVHNFDTRLGKVRLDNPGGQELEINLRYVETFLFEKNGERTAIGNRRQLLRAFPDHRSELRSFVRSNDIDFDNPDDLFRLAEFLEKL